MEKVVLVNECDEPIGTMEKIQAHSLGLLHRAFSAFVFNDRDELLIQQRAKSKYHSGGLWSNTCCSHPRQDEAVIVTTKRRLQEEMGFSTALEKVFDFIYKKELDKGLFEHEFDDVLVGRFNGLPSINREKVSAYKYIGVNELKDDIAKFPHEYTAWFKISFPRVLDNLNC